MQRLGVGTFQAGRKLKVLMTELDSLVQRAGRNPMGCGKPAREKRMWDSYPHF